LKHGYGFKVFKPSGIFCECYYKEGKAEGYGRVIYNNAYEYGEYKDGMKNGYCKFIRSICLHLL
jgi:hypothetical protein